MRLTIKIKKDEKFTMCDRIISLRGEVWAHKSSLTPTLFIEVPAPSQDIIFVCMLPRSTIVL
jgi:hypothetical protein